jgi:hypothetical protein
MIDKVATTRLSKLAMPFSIGIGFVVLFFACVKSLTWRYCLDSPLMIYAGWLCENGWVPYRDFFDMNMPGTYFVMWAMVKLFGSSDFGFRVFDLLCLVSISVSTFFWMEPWGKFSALVAAVSFPIWYLGCGPIFSLQREYLAFVPFAWALVIASGETRFNSILKPLLVGLLTSATLLIKPQFLLLCLPLLIFIFQPGMNLVSMRRYAVALVAGISAPLAATILYLLWNESLSPFLDMAINYWPLYAHMTGENMTISGLDRFVYLVRSTVGGLIGLKLPLAIVGLFALSRDPEQRRNAWALGGLLAAAAIYPATAGQFWHYHWLPFYYVALCLASFTVRELKCPNWRKVNIVYIVAIVFLILSLSKSAVSTFREGNSLYYGLLDVPDGVHNFLSSHMKPGDTAQPLDWGRGAVHGMLMAKIPLATRFMYDFHFYHHVNSPYIQALRREFVKELSANKPRFIIEVQNRPWPHGANTSSEIPELKSFLHEQYVTVQATALYRILERNESRAKPGHPVN